MTNKNKTLIGLTTEQAKILQNQYGKNELIPQKRESFFRKSFKVICEPMFLLLIVAAIIYFVLGEPRDGAIMLVFVIAIISIDIIQEWKTDKTLNALKDLSAPHITVLRDGQEQNIASSELVPGDLMFIHEGVKIPADGVVIKCADLCVDESSLTGEAQGVWKICTKDAKQTNDYWRQDYCYAGTLVTQGIATVLVDKIGSATEYGKIGLGVFSAPDEQTPLQKQTKGLVKVCAVIASVFFVLVGLFTYINIPNHAIENRLIESILSGITLAMAMIPEEFPVILTVFLSMGAWRLAKKHSLVRRLPSVETLGAVSILCVDKTGTITMNQMTVQDTWSFDGDEQNLCHIMGLGCETDAYDPMEKAMLNHCNKLGISEKYLFCGKLIKEYPFTNELKMMGHVWEREDKIIIAVKGSSERILPICMLKDAERKIIESKINEMSNQGLRVITVATASPQSEAKIPDKITDCRLILCGLIGLADPPRDSIKKDIAKCVKAGIRVVMITGDNGVTAKAIAKKIGMPNSDNIITGDMLNTMADEDLREKVKDINIFSRVIPEHKMRIVKAFRENGEVVAMTGDGVNDAPALKYADIGIAMGKRGSEVSREAADLILLDDNFTTIVETIKDGRRIYDNIRKSVGYVFTIHIPIALSSLFAPMLGIAPVSLLLLPLHVVLLELIIDPTCSIVLERQPAERDIMERRPRNSKEKLLTSKNLYKSIMQGLVIFVASFGTYFYLLYENAENVAVARTMGITIIMLSNLLLVQVNSSNHDFAFTSFRRLINDKVVWAINFITVFGLILIIYTPLCDFLKLSRLSLWQFFTAVIIASVAVLWYEIVKFIQKLTKH